MAAVSSVELSFDSVLSSLKRLENLSKVLGWTEQNYTPRNECLLGGGNMHAHKRCHHLWPPTRWPHDIMKNEIFGNFPEEDVGGDDKL